MEKIERNLADALRHSAASIKKDFARELQVSFCEDDTFIEILKKRCYLSCANVCCMYESALKKVDAAPFREVEENTVYQKALQFAEVLARLYGQRIEDAEHSANDWLSLRSMWSTLMNDCCVRDDEEEHPRWLVYAEQPQELRIALVVYAFYISNFFIVEAVAEMPGIGQDIEIFTTKGPFPIMIRCVEKLDEVPELRLLLQDPRYFRISAE